MTAVIAFTLTLAAAPPLTGRGPNVLIAALDSTLFFFGPGDDRYYVLPAGDRIVDLAAGDRCYVLTEHTLLTVDPATRAIQKKSLLPLCYTSLDLLPGKRGSDSLLAALSSDELSLVDPVTHRYVNGIGLAPGEHDILLAPMTRRFHLVTPQLAGTLVQLYDLATGRRLRQLKIDLPNARLQPGLSSVLYAADTSGRIMRLSSDLKYRKSLGCIGPGPVKLYLEGEQLIAVTGQELVLLDANTGQVLDRKIELTDGSARLDPRTLVVFRQPSPTGDDGGLSVVDVPTLVTRGHFSIAGRIDCVLPVDSTAVVLVTAQERSILSIADGSRRELAECVVTSPPPRPGRSPDSCYYLQIGAYQRADKASAVIEDLARQGISAFCDSTTQFFRIRLGGFKTRETAELFAELYPAANWIVYAAKYPGSPVPDGFLSTFSVDQDLLVFRHHDGLLGFVQRIDDLALTYIGPPTCRDSVLEIRRVDGRISVFRFREGGLREEVKNL